MRPFQRTLVSTAVAFALAASGSAAAQFTNAYFFGDSFSDSGNFMSVLPAGTGRFTTNPGPVWSEVFANHFGLAAVPSTQGGTNYAYGGARVTLLPGYPPTPPTGAAVPVATQIQQLIARGPLDRNAIYSVQGGAPDLTTQLAGVLSGTISIAQAQANIATAATQLAQQVATLGAAGARTIVVFNLPDIGKTPVGIASGQSAQISALSSFFNSVLSTGLDAAGTQTIRVNRLALTNEITASPATYGFTNVTAPACGATPAMLCTSVDLVTPNAAQTYFFADGLHPTTAGHAIIAQATASMIDGPQQIATLVEAPFAVEDANFRALDGRMWSSLGAPRTQKKLEAWAAYDYGSSDMSAGLTNGSADTNTIAVGGDMKASDKMLIGGMFGYSENKGDFGGAGGGYKLRQPTGTMYVGYGEGPWYVGATLGAGGLDYSNVDRQIPLGPSVRTESGETRGWEYTGRLLGGYWFNVQDVLHGPYARLAYTKSAVHAYSETGSDSTALSYGAQDREQLVWSLGWQVAGSFGNVRPFARVTWEYDSLDQTPSVTASSVTLGGSYTIPGAKPDNSYALFNLGASSDFGGVTGFITGSGTASRGDGNYWAVTVGIRAPI